LYGHAASATLIGGEWLAKQNALLKAIGGGAGVYRLAVANQINLHDYAPGLADDTPPDDRQRSAIMIDDLLAHMASFVARTVLGFPRLGSTFTRFGAREEGGARAANQAIVSIVSTFLTRFFDFLRRD
jgi:hypothetical protein